MFRAFAFLRFLSELGEGVQDFKVEKKQTVMKVLGNVSSTAIVSSKRGIISSFVLRSERRLCASLK